MSTMKAARFHNAKDIRVEEVEVPTPGKGQILIEVKYAGICGSDLHEYSHGPNAVPMNAPYALSGHQGVTTMGHEFSGVVAGLGEGVSKFKPGDRVVIEPLFRDLGSENAAKGKYNLSDHYGFVGFHANGGFAKYAVVWDYMVHPIPDTLSFEHAAITEPAAVSVYGVLRSGLTLGQTCCIFGAGPIGILTVQAAKAAGATTIIVSDISDARLAVAKEVGATHIINGKDPDLVEKIRDIGHGGVDITYECAGVQPTFTAATQVLKSGGTMVVLAIIIKPVELNALDLVLRELDIKGSLAYRNIYPEVIRLIDRGIIEADKVISGKINLDDIVAEGFERLLNNPTEVKILVNLERETIS